MSDLQTLFTVETIIKEVTKCCVGHNEGVVLSLREQKFISKIFSHKALLRNYTFNIHLPQFAYFITTKRIQRDGHDFKLPSEIVR